MSKFAIQIVEQSPQWNDAAVLVVLHLQEWCDDSGQTDCTMLGELALMIIRTQPEGASNAA